MLTVEVTKGDCTSYLMEEVVALINMRVELGEEKIQPISIAGTGEGITLHMQSKEGHYRLEAELEDVSCKNKPGRSKICFAFPKKDEEIPLMLIDIIGNDAALNKLPYNCIINVNHRFYNTFDISYGRECRTIDEVILKVTNIIKK